MPNLFGTKWGDPALGTPGGTVTWSIVAGGVSGVREAYDLNRGDLTVDAEDVLPYDPDEALREAFAAWGDAADIQFLQIADGGEEVAEGAVADIRIAFGQIDGSFGGTVGLAFFSVDGDPPPFAGDVLFDSDERRFFSERDQFVNTAIHEIGHSIGLDHVEASDVQAIMNPITSDATSLFDDDIEGVQRIYGAERGRDMSVALAEDQADIEVLEAVNGLSLFGNGLDNLMLGGGGDERIRGEDGADNLAGRAGFDTLLGGAGDDTLRGGGRDDRLKGGSGDDLTRGGGGEDTVVGGSGDDVLRGGGGADVLKGGGGDDLILGGSGPDSLRGGGGNDTLEGGGGPDDFQFRGTFDDDVIQGGLDDDDALDFAGADGVSGLADLTFSASGEDLLIEAASGSVRVLGEAALAEDPGAILIFF